jgi:hypothetical protein
VWGKLQNPKPMSIWELGTEPHFRPPNPKRTSNGEPTRHPFWAGKAPKSEA